MCSSYSGRPVDCSSVLAAIQEATELVKAFGKSSSRVPTAFSRLDSIFTKLQAQVHRESSLSVQVCFSPLRTALYVVLRCFRSRVSCFITQTTLGRSLLPIYKRWCWVPIQFKVTFSFFLFFIFLSNLCVWRVKRLLLILSWLKTIKKTNNPKPLRSLTRKCGPRLRTHGLMCGKQGKCIPGKIRQRRKAEDKILFFLSVFFSLSLKDVDPNLMDGVCVGFTSTWIPGPRFSMLQSSLAFKSCFLTPFE